MQNEPISLGQILVVSSVLLGVSRFTVGAPAFFILSQWGERP